MRKKIDLTETVLRDGHQSLMATRMTTQDMLPAIELMDTIGYRSLECWGGATFDAAIRYLNEDPWDRLREIKKRVKHTKLQMLLRGQNLLGYRHYADDVVESFISTAATAGIDIFRIFDALNDTRNLETSLKAVKASGKHAQLTVCYSISPVHTEEYFKQLAMEMEAMGADSLCVKDMAGILTPYKARQFIASLKKVISIPIQLHTHATSGTAEMTYLEAAKAGIDQLDCAISPFAGGTSQPSSEIISLVLKEYGFDIDVDMKKMTELATYFKQIKEKYVKEGIFDSKMLGIEPLVSLNQMPGGMLSNLYSQLKEADAVHQFDAVLAEVPSVHQDLGFPPLVTPMSQMVGTQAVFNVVSGERYKMVSNEIKDYLRGRYGKAPSEIDAKIQTKIIGDEKATYQRPADLLQPEMAELRATLGDLAKTEEDVLIYAMFPQVGKAFLERKYARPEKKQLGTPRITIRRISK